MDKDAKELLEIISKQLKGKTFVVAEIRIINGKRVPIIEEKKRC